MASVNILETLERIEQEVLGQDRSLGGEIELEIIRLARLGVRYEAMPRFDCDRLFEAHKMAQWGENFAIPALKKYAERMPMIFEAQEALDALPNFPEASA